MERSYIKFHRDRTADAIIAARPINDREDSKRVKGFSFKKFDALKAALESENAPVDVQLDEPVAEAKTDPEPEVKKSSIGKILLRTLVALSLEQFFRFVFRHSLVQRESARSTAKQYCAGERTNLPAGRRHG